MISIHYISSIFLIFSVFVQK